MELPQRPSVCEGIHRHGWPYVTEALQKLHKPGSKILLDDFVEATFTHTTAPPQYKRNWVGIFHHPARINSPISGDNKYLVQKLPALRKFHSSMRTMVGAVALSPRLGDALHELFPRLPILVIKHPTYYAADGPLKTWIGTDYYPRVLWQAGFFLRNSKFIEMLDVEQYGLHRSKSAPWLAWHLGRERLLERVYRAKLVTPDAVIKLRRMDDLAYDSYMANSVVAMHVYGASANNVLVECMARNTPILVNDLSEIRYYLGDGYPLYFSSVADTPKIAKLIGDKKRVLAAHQYLRAQDKSWMCRERFAKQIEDFCNAI